MFNTQNPSTIDKILDVFKQGANKIINNANSMSVKYGNGGITPRFETIADKQANDYQKVIEARRIAAAGGMKDDPRNNNYIYRGVVGNIKPSNQKVKIVATASKNNQLTPTRVPTTTPTAIPLQNHYVPRFDFRGYEIRRPGFEGKTIPQPPPKIAKIIYETFAKTNEATPAAAVAWSENGTFNPNVVGEPNYNGTRDYGLFQINSGTLSGLLNRRPKQMAAIGVKTVEDLKDPKKNALVAQLIRMDERWASSQPWGQWYGWQGKNTEGNYVGKDINLQEMINKLNKMLPKKKK